MFKNYFMSSIRYLLRNKFHTLVNVLGMGVSIGCILLILFFIRNELSYDTFHSKADSIYRIYLEQRSSRNTSNSIYTPSPLVEVLQSEFPSIKNSVRIAPDRIRWLRTKDRSIKARVTPVDSSLFQLFSFPLEQGDPKSALANVNNVILSKQIARKLFGGKNPLGRTITIQDLGDFAVTGVLVKIPPNSSLNFDALIHPNYIPNRSLWNAFSVQTYVQLQDPSQQKELESRCSSLLEAQFPLWMTKRAKYRLHFQPLTDIYFNKEGIPGLPHPGNINYIYILSMIGLFIAVIACINFINISIANSSNRTREIGMRKTFGANKFQLWNQFVGEAFLVSLIALIVGFGFAELFMPSFTKMIDKKIAMDYSLNWTGSGIFFGILVFFTFLAGTYPALFLSKHHPVLIIKQGIGVGKSGVMFRKTLITVQFVLSIMLFIATIVIYSQWNYLKTKSLGFNEEQIVYLPYPETRKELSLAAIKAGLKQHPNILEVTACLGRPGDSFFWGAQVWLPEKNKHEYVNTIFSTVDEDFIPTLKIRLKEGRNFSRKFSTDAQQAIIINETMARKLGLQSPVGHQIEIGYRDFPKGLIIGVVKDFHLKPLLYDMEPILLNLKPIFGYDHLLVRLSTKNISSAIQFLKSQWRQITGGKPFEYHFVNEAFEQSYHQEKRWSKIIFSFATLAIFLTLAGLFALTSLIVVQRTKEIGIRKVLGASTSNILILFIREFADLILLANIIAWPGIYWILQKWLQNYPYRIAIGWQYFLIPGSIVLLLAIATVSIQAIQAALANPVETLRYE